MTPLPLWRILSTDRAGHALDPVRNPEGRFHHDGAPALYASLSPQGAGASLTRYLAAGDPPRVIVGLDLSGGAVLDLDDTAHLPEGADPSTATARWDLDRAAGRRPATWALADTVRTDGWDGMIYPSRLRPDLRNLVLFNWNAGTAPTLRVAVPPAPWPPA